MLKPGFRTTEEKPKFGNDGAMTWKAGPPPALLVSIGSILVTSINDPGPVHVNFVF